MTLTGPSRIYFIVYHILDNNKLDFRNDFDFGFNFSSRIEHDEAEEIVKSNPEAGPDEKIENEMVNEWTFAKM